MVAVVVVAAAAAVVVVVVVVEALVAKMIAGYSFYHFDQHEFSSG